MIKTVKIQLTQVELNDLIHATQQKLDAFRRTGRAFGLVGEKEIRRVARMLKKLLKASEMLKEITDAGV